MKMEDCITQKQDGWYFLDETSRWIGPYRFMSTAIYNYHAYMADLDGVGPGCTAPDGIIHAS